MLMTEKYLFLHFCMSWTSLKHDSEVLQIFYRGISAQWKEEGWEIVKEHKLLRGGGVIGLSNLYTLIYRLNLRG